MPAHPLVRSARRGGSALIELALSLSFAFPLLLGVGSVGIRLARTFQATQLTRDVAHLYALGADFSLPGTQAIAKKLSADSNLSSSGKAVLLFSRIYRVQQTDCTAASVNPCTNLDLPVITQRIVMGNPALRTSQFATPAAGYLSSAGNITAANYCKYASLVAAGFDSVLTLAAGQSTTVVEGYFAMPEINFLNLPNSGGGYYVRFLY